MNLFFLVAVAWWFVNFEPLQLLFDFIFTQIKVSHLSNYVHSSLGCWKCWSFWLTFFYLGSFQLACIAALTAFIIDICLNRLNAKQ
jgi:hypothetical protein